MAPVPAPSLSNPGKIWILNVPGYELSDSHGFVMRDFLGKDPTALYIEVADKLASEDPKLRFPNSLALESASV